MPKPNFFIIGAQKCGTTALHTYLKSHPQIFTPRVKEIHYFASDHPNYHIVHNMKDYLGLFQSAESYPVISEGSTTYLSSAVAVQNVYDFNPDAKIVIMVRNPIKMVQSFHSHMLYFFEEDVTDFETAWRLQDDRRKGRNLPKTCRDPYFLFYSDLGKMGEQIERVLSIFPREQVKVILFDDFTKDTKAVYEDVLAFLGLPSDNRTEFPPVYEGRSLSKNKFSRLVLYLLRPPKILVRIKDRLNIHGTGLLAKPTKMLTTKSKREAVSPELHAEMVETFRADVEKLSRIVGRDLSHWLNYSER
jgi:hypothetical protein